MDQRGTSFKTNSQNMEIKEIGKGDGDKEDRDSCDIVYILWLKVLNNYKDKIR